MTICPNCGAEFTECGNIGADRAGGTSQRCGNPPAELFSEPFSDPIDPPKVLSVAELSERLSQDGLMGNIDAISFLLGRVSYRTVRKYCRAIERRASPGELVVDNVQTLALFDRALQGVMLQGIGAVELQFRATLARFMTDSLGPFAHHHPENFRNHDFYISFLEDYSRELGYKLEGRKVVNPEDFRAYGDVPVWQAVEILPLGTLSKLYRNMLDKSVRHGVADSFGVKYEILVSWLRTICEIRNRCAHFEDVCVTPLTSKPKKIPGVNAANDGAFYACLVICKLVEGNVEAANDPITHTHVTNFSTSLIRLTERMPEPVFLAAGFPRNWVKQLKQTSSFLDNVYRITIDEMGREVEVPVR